ncbi:20214_t:CDS:2, partial [Rhizophagus irregularis]
AINESSTISFYIPSVVISPPSSIKTMISDKATSGGKAASGKAASGKASGKAASGKIASGKASGKAASGSSKLPSSSVKAVITVSSGEFAKLIQINQKTASKLNTIINNQERFEAMLNEQKDQISNIMSVLDSHRNVETEVE